MVDSQITESIKSGDLVLEPFDEGSLQPASYDMRVGKRAIVSGNDDEIDVEKKGSVTVKAGDFALLTTLETVKLSPGISGTIGIRSYFSRKGIVLLSGLQIDPGFEGVLVVGVYNASPRSLVIDYQSPYCTIEFHKLSQPASKVYESNGEQVQGRIPRADKDYLRTLETETLSELSKSMQELSRNVGALTSSSKVNWRIMYSIVIPLLFLILGKLILFPT